ncbi:MAG: FAD-dependent oxidoreductase, partial [bacterium]|nr:FAD-dependent oxidoreductase [bacterium]
MTKCDVVVIGAGAAGLSAGALLAAEGKSVTLLERSPFLGGRALAVDDDGFKVNLGGHLIEDPGSGLTKVFEHVGKELIHGEVSHDMPIWDN